MVALRTLGSVILAAIFLSIFASFYIHYQSGSAGVNFRCQAEQLAQRIEFLGNQDPGTRITFEIEVPSSCELHFEENSVVIVIGGALENFDTGVAISGPSLSDKTAKLTLGRVENGMVVSVQ